MDTQDTNTAAAEEASSGDWLAGKVEVGLITHGDGLNVQWKCKCGHIQRATVPVEVAAEVKCTSRSCGRTYSLNLNVDVRQLTYPVPLTRRADAPDVTPEFVAQFAERFMAARNEGWSDLRWANGALVGCAPGHVGKVLGVALGDDVVVTLEAELTKTQWRELVRLRTGGDVVLDNGPE